MTTRLASEPRATRRGDRIGLVVTALAWAVLTAFIALALREPAHVDQITVHNPHPWDVHVIVTDANRDGWVGLGGLDHHDQNTFQSVLDQGDTWIFRFSYAGEEAETRVRRDQLEQDDWSVTVPDELATRLRSAGIPERPR